MVQVNPVIERKRAQYRLEHGEFPRDLNGKPIRHGDLVITSTLEYVAAPGVVIDCHGPEQVLIQTLKYLDESGVYDLGVRVMSASPIRSVILVDLDHFPQDGSGSFERAVDTIRSVML